MKTALLLMLMGLSLSTVNASEEEEQPQPDTSCVGVNQFAMKQGTLKDNIIRMMTIDYVGASLIYDVGRHSVYVDTCLQYDSLNHLVQQMIEPYVSPQSIYFMSFRNNVVAVFYQNDAKYSQYLRSAR